MTIPLSWWRRLVWASLVIWLAGCAGMRPVPEPQRAASPSDIKVWKLEGRIAVKTANDGWTANLIWEHDPRQDRLRISGPFSQGLLSIVVQDDLIHVNEGNGVEQTSRNPDALLRERLGFAVPLRSLRYWVTGVPAPEAEHVQVPNETGGARRFSQQGWNLAYEKFSQIGAYQLPQKASINGHDVRLKLIADDWLIKE
ncbi:lipoprotein insertase outer membrane protein LolB [Methyloterricola oryzae]|uniref:lipoprotein insertase outer membrane protein LolB n=1 Tax=Methyloterricola oryzae TaxID=1495050 RepID=UPI00069C4B3D|nr:lipoprotein insertase outer membrane protein LolB [Methyloterricola oryzae]